MALVETVLLNSQIRKRLSHILEAMSKCLAIIVLFGLSAANNRMDALKKCNEKYKNASYLTDGVEKWPNHEMMCRIHCAM
ncbi:hypothetical protein R5R35_011253 [Gryllus longicercus]|uniref:Uncharacterized protein n=1 Tax=Gryllus longicercus TaxID=2509291 RepID=A0AAN9Z774_9ORTH